MMAINFIGTLNLLSLLRRDVQSCCGAVSRNKTPQNDALLWTTVWCVTVHVIFGSISTSMITSCCELIFLMDLCGFWGWSTLHAALRSISKVVDSSMILRCCEQRGLMDPYGPPTGESRTHVRRLSSSPYRRVAQLRVKIRKQILIINKNWHDTMQGVSI